MNDVNEIIDRWPIINEWQQIPDWYFKLPINKWSERDNPVLKQWNDDVNKFWRGIFDVTFDVRHIVLIQTRCLMVPRASAVIRAVTGIVNHAAVDGCPMLQAMDGGYVRADDVERFMSVAAPPEGPPGDVWR